MLRRHPESLATKASGWDRFITPILLVGAVSYVIGLLAPAVHMTALLIIPVGSLSPLEMAVEMIGSGEIGPFLSGVSMLAGFGVVGWGMWSLHSLWRRVPMGQLKQDWRYVELARPRTTTTTLGEELAGSAVTIMVLALILSAATLLPIFAAEIGGGLLLLGMTAVIAGVVSYRIPRAAKLHLDGPKSTHD